MSSVPALSADVLPDVAATLSGVPLQWEENRSSASLAELASVLVEALQSAQQSASAQQWAEPYLAVNNVRVPAGFAFARESSQRTVSDWLAYVENFCSGMRVAHPVALAAVHLQDEALRWYLAWQSGRDPYGIPWSEFKSAMLASSLVDPYASQDLLDEQRALTQGSRSIIEYVRFATTLHQRGSSHRFLASYPQHFWIESFRAGLNSELQSRMPAISESTTFEELKQRNPREGVRPLSRGRRNGPGGRGMQPTRAGWYRGIFNESPNRREPVKRYPQRVIINTHLWEPGEALTMHLSADVYLLTGERLTWVPL